MAYRAGTGFTIIEFMVTIVIVTILLTLVMPATGNLLERHRVTTAANELHLDLHLARQTAVAETRRVTVCPSTDGATCTGNYRWEHGWIVFSDANGNRDRESGEPLIKVQSGLDGFRIDSGRRPAFRFYPDGTAPGNTGSIYICNPAVPDEGRRLVTANLGRVRQEPYPGACSR